MPADATRALDAALDGSGDAYDIVKAASRKELETVVQMVLHAHRPMRVRGGVECFRDGQPWPCGEFGEIARELASTVAGLPAEGGG